MSNNQKNIKLLKTSPSSQWKVVPQQDESESDDVPDGSNRNKPESRPEESRTTRQPPGFRVLRDANAFYRNDTSHFLGELQQAETQLFAKVNTANKIDFFPAKRKKSPKTESNDAQNRGFDEQLSDSNIVSVPKPRKSDHKNTETEKLIVDIDDFVETFSVFRKPDYLRRNEKKDKKSSALEQRSEFDFLLEQIQQRRENDAICQTIDDCPDTQGRVVIEDIAESMDNVGEPSITCHEFFPFVDSTIVVDGTMPHLTGMTFGTVEDVCPCHTEIPLKLPETHREVEIPPQQNDVRVFQEHDASTHNHTPAEEQNVSEKKTESVEVTNAHDASVCANKPFQDAGNDFSLSVMTQLPEILERLCELAGEQCDSLVDFIKDKVYDNSRLIAFCGMKRGVGCSTMTMLAAKGITRHGLKTAIIDANFEFPRFNAMVTGQPENEASWVNVLHGTVSWETLGITPKDMPLLTIFPLAENALVNWSQYEPERLQQETNRFVSTLQEYYDLILFDCGCFEDTFEEITWGELALFQPDGVILVCNPKETPFEVLKPCCREILSGNIGVIGVAENFV